MALDPGCGVRGLTESELLTSFPTAHLADHDWLGGNANPYLDGLRELITGLVQRADDLQPSPNGTGGIIFMRSRIAKVD